MGRQVGRITGAGQQTRGKVMKFSACDRAFQPRIENEGKGLALGEV